MTMFPVLFAIPRTSGWLAQWQEMLLDPEQKSPGLVRFISDTTLARTCPWINASSGRPSFRDA